MTTSQPLIDVAELPLLGWQHPTAYNPAMFDPVGPGQFKPTGGLWTTPLRGTSTVWTRFVHQTRVRDPIQPITVIHPDPRARVYRIDNYGDFASLARGYPLREHPDPAMELYRQITSDGDGIDWRAVAADIDAVWLTWAGMAATCHSRPGLAMWDMETVFFLQPRLSVGHTIQPRNFEPKRLTREQITQNLTVYAQHAQLTAEELTRIVDIIDAMGIER